MADHAANAAYPEGGQRKEIYTYQAPWTVYSLAWSRRLVFCDELRPRVLQVFTHPLVAVAAATTYL